MKGFMKNKKDCISTPTLEQQLRARPLAEASFERHCENLGLRCTFAQNIVFVQSKCSHWRIYHDGCFVTKLEHENYKRSFPFLKQKHFKFGEGFHQQKLRNKDIYDVAYYITHHDSI